MKIAHLHITISKHYACVWVYVSCTYNATRNEIIDIRYRNVFIVICVEIRRNRRKKSKNGSKKASSQCFSFCFLSSFSLSVHCFSVQHNVFPYFFVIAVPMMIVFSTACIIISLL